MTLLQRRPAPRGSARSREQPWTSAAIILTLALAIGANSAIFTVVNAVLLRPLPYAAPDRVVMLREVDPRGRDSSVSLADFDDLRSGAHHDRRVEPDSQRRRSTSPASASRNGSAADSSPPASSTCSASSRSIGRAFAAGEDCRGAPKTAVLAYRTWQQRFGARPVHHRPAAAAEQRATCRDRRPAAWLRVSDRRPGRLAAVIRRIPFRIGSAAARNSLVIRRACCRTSPMTRRPRSCAEGARLVGWRIPRRNSQLVAALRAVPRRRGRPGRAQSQAALRRGWVRAADRLREHRQPAAGARRFADSARWRSAPRWAPRACGS